MQIERGLIYVRYSEETLYYEGRETLEQVAQGRL